MAIKEDEYSYLKNNFLKNQWARFKKKKTLYEKEKGAESTKYIRMYNPYRKKLEDIPEQ